MAIIPASLRHHYRSRSITHVRINSSSSYSYSSNINSSSNSSSSKCTQTRSHLVSPPPHLIIYHHQYRTAFHKPSINRILHSENFNIRTTKTPRNRPKRVNSKLHNQKALSRAPQQM
jgi:hypothetical protein